MIDFTILIGKLFLYPFKIMSEKYSLNEKTYSLIASYMWGVFLLYVKFKMQSDERAMMCVACSFSEGLSANLCDGAYLLDYTK